MNCARITMAAVAAATALSAGVAFAASPSECTTGPEVRSYEAAYTAHSRFLETLFKTSYGCRDLEAFSDKVLELTLGVSTTDPCRGAGFRDAANDTIAKVTHECLGGGASAEPAVSSSSALRVADTPEGECERNGREAGNISAEMYCAPACPGCDRAPGVPVCDALAALYCKQAFNKYVNTHADCRSRALGDPHFSEVVDAACAPP